MIRTKQILAPDEKIDSNQLAWLASVDFDKSAIYPYHTVLWTLNGLTVKIGDEDMPILANNFNGSYPGWFINITDRLVKRRLKECGNTHLTLHAKRLLDCIQGMEDLKEKVAATIVKGELQRA